MGLDVSHGCWHGAYSSFYAWRNKLSEVAGYGSINDYAGYGGSKSWPNSGDALIVLLDHSDCDGSLPVKILAPLADRLAELLPALEIAGDAGGHTGNYAKKTQVFIDGLRYAASRNEIVEFE